MTSPASLEARDALSQFLAWEDDRRAAAFAIWGTPAPVGRFVIGPPLVHSRERVTFLLWDSADPPEARFPYRAMLLRRRDGQWAIRSIQSQCTACFGTGLVEADSQLCDSCQAEGWGVSNGRKRPVVVAA